MRYVVEVDERGRLTLPKKVREKLGIKGKVLIRIREGIVEIIPLDRLRKEISELIASRSIHITVTTKHLFTYHPHILLKLVGIYQ